jgi:hypothetical protein
LLIFDRSHSDVDIPFQSEALPYWKVKEIEGVQYRIMKVGSVDDFPLVDLYVGVQNISNYPTPINYQWQRWDLERQEFVGPVETSGAQAREEKVRARGDLIGEDELSRR